MHVKFVIQGLRQLPFFIGDLLVIELSQTRKILDHVKPIIGELRAVILLEPQGVQFRAALQMQDLSDIRNQVLADIQLLQLLAICDVGERSDLVEGEREDLDVGHPADDRDIVEIAAPDIEVLYQIDAVAFGAALGERFSEFSLHLNFVES